MGRNEGRKEERKAGSRKAGRDEEGREEEGGRKRKGGLLCDDVLVQHLAELGRDELARIVTVVVDDSADGGIRCLAYLLIEISNELAHDAGDVALAPYGVNKLEA